jgi:hypothetical protein
MAISETGDVRVPSCVTLTTTSRAAPARRIEGRRMARPAYFGILAFVKTRTRDLMADAREAYLAPDFVSIFELKIGSKIGSIQMILN